MVAFRILMAFVDNARKTIAGGPRQDLATKASTLKNAIVCRTHDELNADLARCWCDENGLDFRLVQQRDELFPVDARALAIDLNHLGLGPSERAQFAERLCQVLPPYPVAVASYDLGSAVKGALLTRGWLVFRRIEPRLLYELVAATNYDMADSVA